MGEALMGAALMGWARGRERLRAPRPLGLHTALWSRGCQLGPGGQPDAVTCLSPPAGPPPQPFCGLQSRDAGGASQMTGDPPTPASAPTLRRVCEMPAEAPAESQGVLRPGPSVPHPAAF